MRSEIIKQMSGRIFTFKLGMNVIISPLNRMWKGHDSKSRARKEVFRKPLNSTVFMYLSSFFHVRFSI